MKKSNIFKGVEFKDSALMRALEYAHNNNIRVRVWYGDNGAVWEEEHEVVGYIGRSTGEVKLPLLIYNNRSLGGAQILTDKVVRIVSTKGEILYKKDGYEIPDYVPIGNEVWIENESLSYTGHGESGHAKLWARCESHESAKRLADFMSGKRFNK